MWLRGKAPPARGSKLHTMTTTIGQMLRRKEKEEEYQVAVPSLSDLAGPGLTEEPPAPVEVEEVQGEVLPPPSNATADEVFLVIAPGTDPSLVFRFCQSIRKIEGVDLAFLTSSPKGITMKLILRKLLPILPIIAMMEEVAEASREGTWAKEPDWGLPPFLTLNAEKTLGVTLRAF